MKVSDDIDGFILAGGASSRMGVDKANLRLGGETLLTYAVKTMSAFTRNVTVVGNDLSVDVVAEPFRVIADLGIEPVSPVGAGRAPILGLFTALTSAGSEWIAVLAVDLPFVTGELLLQLALLRRGEVDAIVPVQTDGRLQPLCALYRRDVCLEAVRMAIEAGEFSLYKLLGGLNVCRVGPAAVASLTGAESFFVNVNTPADLEVAAALIENSRSVS